MVKFYRHFLPKAVHYGTLLNAFMSGPKIKESREVVWSPETAQTFQSTKQLTDATFLALSRQDAVSVDALDIAVGAGLYWKVNQSWQPLSFFSKLLNAAQGYYSTYGSELLVVYLSIKYFRWRQAVPFVRGP